MKFRRFVLCLILLLLAGSAFSADYQPRYLEITFLTTNDLHAKLWPFDIAPNPARNYPGVKNIGGAARRATVIRTIRSETRTPVFLTDAGDTTHGHTVLAKAYHGAADVAVMNATGYDAMVPGNHDFQWHAVDTVRNIEDSEFPWVCANLVDAESGKPFLPPYVILDADGTRVAFFGLTNSWISTRPRTYVAGPELGLKVLDPLETAAKMVSELRAKADVVVLLSHLGLGSDTRIAKEVPGIDVILGGHSHSTLRTPRLVSVGEPTAFSLGVVPIAQAGYYGRYMGRTKLIFRRDDATGRYTLMSCKGELITIDSSIPDDPEITQIIQDFQKRIPPPAPPKQTTN